MNGKDSAVTGADALKPVGTNPRNISKIAGRKLKKGLTISSWGGNAAFSPLINVTMTKKDK